jgi:multicomponent Na+:H+ antiporter subunit E
VAYRVLHPDLPIKPGTIRVKTSLKSDAGLTFLANSVTLTPGTTSVDIDRDKGLIYIHMLYISDSYDKDSMKLKVVDKFEKILRRIFE